MCHSFVFACCVNDTLLQVGQALRYAKAISGWPDDPGLAMRHDEGLGGWTPLLLVQSVYALWEAILLSPAPPLAARGPCPAQGYQYALAVYHYTRCLAFGAHCSANSTSSACSQAKEELQHLQAWHSCADKDCTVALIRLVSPHSPLLVSASKS